MVTRKTTTKIVAVLHIFILRVTSPEEKAFARETAGRPTSYHLAMDSMVGDRVVQSDLDVRSFGHPSVVERGKIGGALRLDGSGQYVSLGRQHDACLGNLDLCRHGLLLAAWLRPGTLRDGMYN